MAEIAVSLLSNKLSAWIAEERELQGKLAQEVKYTRDELSHMRAFLRVADAKEENDLQLQEWITQLRESAYQVEDVLDNYMLQFVHQADGFVGYIKRAYALMKSLKARHHIARQIQKIKLRIKNISEAQQRYRDTYGFVDQGSSSIPTDDEWYTWRGDALLSEEAELVGIEKPKRQLVERLLSKGSGLNVTSVVGTDGLGKTTLVKKVYNDAQVKVRFTHHVWITVSESITVYDLLINMIERLSIETEQPLPERLEAMSVDDMKETVYEFLLNKSYILVLDDVREINVWDVLKYAFPRSSSYGCIVITTCFDIIGHVASMETNGNVYNMKPLTEVDSRELFNKKAFPGSTCPPYLKELAVSILKKCGGLPLVIVAIGSLLSIKKNRADEWEMFHGSIGDELEGDNLKRVMKLLSLSYYDLPCHLKSCFLYLSVFLEDPVMDAYELIRLWIAEGFVEAKEGKTMEEVGEGYVSELANRSLIQVVEINRLDATPSQFRVHNLVRQVIISMSRHQNFVSIPSRRQTIWPEKIRRLAIHYSVNTTQESDFSGQNFENLRSLVFLGAADSKAKVTLRSILDGNCRLLKLLHLDELPLSSIPKEFFKLYYLTYLSLRNTKVNTIPSSIGNLCNLKFFALANTKVTELPIEILRLHRLRQLIVHKAKKQVNGCPLFGSIKGFKAPYKIGVMSSLQCLRYIEADHFGDKKIVAEIGKLTQLRYLGIRMLREGDGKDLCSSLSKLVHLQYLHLVSSHEYEFLDLQTSLLSSLQLLQQLVLEGRLNKVPQWITALHGLKRVLLKWSRLKEDPLESLENLPRLEELQLYLAYDGERFCFKAGKFRRLRKLGVEKLTSLKWLTVEESSMPNLEELSIWKCELLELPFGIEHLPKLQIVEFTDMPEDFVDKLKKQKEEEGKNWKLAYIPKIVIINWKDGGWEGWTL